MKLILIATLATCLMPFASSSSHAQAWQDSDAICRNWGTTPGTKAYYECRSAIERPNSDAYAPGQGSHSAPPVAKPANQNVSDGMAKSLCEQHAKKSAPYPIERLSSHMVFPGKIKRVSLSYKIKKPGSSIAFWNAECKFENGRMIDFNAH